MILLLLHIIMVALEIFVRRKRLIMDGIQLLDLVKFFSRELCFGSLYCRSCSSNISSHLGRCHQCVGEV